MSYLIVIKLMFNYIILLSILTKTAYSRIQQLSALKDIELVNCTVGNLTYFHGETFKLDCKTICICQNGLHACSSLCPKENLPAPIETSKCHSPRLVDVPDRCCKMWLCEKPLTDVSEICQNVSTSHWTTCSERCGIGVATRNADLISGCQPPSTLRLCQHRRCNTDTDDVISQENSLLKHRIRKGHICRNMHTLGPSRLRLGPCVSRNIYRPKICGQCYDTNKCCVPSESTTIEIELLCPSNSGDPFNFVKTKQHLWDNKQLDLIDQRILQSRNMYLVRRFIAVQWILKCVCDFYGDGCS